MCVLILKEIKERLFDVSYVKSGLYFDIVRFLETYKEKISGDELTTLHIVSGAHLLKEDVKPQIIVEAQNIIAKYGRAPVGAPPFDPNDRAAIEAALASRDPDNPIALEIAERVKAAMGLYWVQAEKLERMPTELVLVRPKTALDDIACRLFVQTIADTLGQKLTVVWVDEESQTATPVE